MKLQTLFLILILLFVSLFINVDIGKHQKSSAIANIRIDDLSVQQADLKENIDSSIAVNQPLTEISSDFPKTKCNAQINAKGALLKYINSSVQTIENENIFEFLHELCLRSFHKDIHRLAPGKNGNAVIELAGMDVFQRRDEERNGWKSLAKNQQRSAGDRLRRCFTFKRHQRAARAPDQHIDLMITLPPKRKFVRLFVVIPQAL